MASNEPVFFQLQQQYNTLCRQKHGDLSNKIQSITNLEKYFRALQSCYSHTCPKPEIGHVELHGCAYVEHYIQSLSDLHPMTLDDVIKEVFAKSGHRKRVKELLTKLDNDIDNLTSQQVTTRVQVIANLVIPKNANRRASTRYGRVGLLIGAILVFSQLGKTVAGKPVVETRGWDDNMALTRHMGDFMQTQSSHHGNPQNWSPATTFSTKFQMTGWLFDRAPHKDESRYTIPLHDEPKAQILDHLKHVPSRYQDVLNSLPDSAIQMTNIISYNNGLNGNSDGDTFHQHFEDGYATLIYIPNESNIPPITHSRWTLKTGDMFEVISLKNGELKGITTGGFSLSDFEFVDNLETIVNADQTGTEYIPLPNYHGANSDQVPSLFDEYVETHSEFIEPHVQSTEVGTISDITEVHLHRGVLPKPGHVRIVVAIVFPWEK